MERKFFVLFWLCGIAGYALALDTGYPAGYMSDCPGMNATTEFTEETRRSLSAVVMWPTPGFVRSRETTCRLSRSGAACAARWLDLRKRKTQVLISGYLDASFSPVIRSVAGPYLALGRNVIVVEIFPLLVRPYPIAARITRPLGKVLGEFLAELTNRGLSPNRLEISGGSLGAHIAYYASVKYRELTGRKPARLTALDPAGPCFRNLPPYERFNSDGAEKVDVLHTNIDGFGLADPMGHVDFYANGGVYKQAWLVTCPHPIRTVQFRRSGESGRSYLLDTNIDGFGLAVDFYGNGGEYQPAMVGGFILPCFLVCSHLRSAFYWLLAHENPDKFIGVRCESLEKARHGDCYDGPIVPNYLGPKTNHSIRGIFYLPTTETSPYYLGEQGLTKRKYGHNDYLLRTSSEADVFV